MKAAECSFAEPIKQKIDLLLLKKTGFSLKHAQSRTSVLKILFSGGAFPSR
jgi:hypothetical protein